jgi:hypothetical protein
MKRELEAAGRWVVETLKKPLNIPVKMPSGRVVMPDETLSEEEFEREMTAPTPVVEPAPAPIVKEPEPAPAPEPTKPKSEIINRGQSKPPVPEGLEGYAYARCKDIEAYPHHVRFTPVSSSFAVNASETPRFDGHWNVEPL